MISLDTIRLDTIRAAHRSADLQIVRPVLAQAGTDATKILRGFEATERDNDTVSFLRLGQELALAALRL